MLMKRIRTICVALCALLGFGVMNAQVMDASKIAVAEPEFDMDALLLLNETEAVPLQIENSTVRSTYDMAVALVGVDQMNTYHQFSGGQSPITLAKEAFNHDLYLIIRWSDNRLNPNRLIQIMSVEIKKNRRIYNVMKTSDLEGVKLSNQNLVNFTATKYGESSYLIKISSDELKRYRENNKKEMNKFGKQFIIRFNDTREGRVTDTEAFLTFGISSK